MSSKLGSTSYISPSVDLSSPYLNYGSNSKNKSIRVDRKQENANRMNVLMNQRENSQSHLTPDNKIQVITTSSIQRDGRLFGALLPHTPTTMHSLTPPAVGLQDIRHPSR